MKLCSESKSLIIDAMRGLSGPPARRRAEELAAQHSVSTATIYNVSKDVRPTRARRADAGTHRVQFGEDTLNYLIAMTHRTDMPAEMLTEIGANNGHPELADVSPATIRRRLASAEASRAHFKQMKERKPRRRWEAARPNDIHQIDYTVAQQFYVDDDGSIGFESPLSRNKNKPGNKKPRLILFALVDDHSRVRFLRGYPGNNTTYMLDFLWHAWRPKGSHAFPFHGLPKKLYTDNDAIIKSQRFTDAMEKLGVEVATHFPGESQAKGKVEAVFKWASQVEKVSLLTKFASVEEFNSFWWDRMLSYNNREHRETEEKPFHRWMTICADELRETPAEKLYDCLFYYRFTPKVNKFLEISIKGIRIQLPRQEHFYRMVGQRPTVFWHPKDSSRITVAWEGSEYDVAVIEPKPDVAGAHRAAPLTQTERHAEAAEAADLSGQKLYGWHAEKHQADVFMPRRGREFDGAIAPIGAERMLDILEAAERLQAAGVVSNPLRPDQRAEIEALADADGLVAEAEIERIAREGFSQSERKKEAG